MRIILATLLLVAALGAPAGAEPRFPVKDAATGRWGYVDVTGKVVIAHQFSDVTQFHEGRAAVCRERTEVKWVEDGTERTAHEPIIWEYIDEAGRTVIRGPHRVAGRFSDGLAAVGLDRKGPYGYVDRKGKLVIPHRFARAGDFHDGRAVVRDAEMKAAAIDKKGKVVVAFSTRWLNDFSEGLAAFSPDQKLWGYLDTRGREVIAPRYARAEAFEGGAARVQLDPSTQRESYIDRQGRNLPSAPRATAPDRVPVKVGAKYGYADRDGELVIKPQWASASAFRDGLGVVADAEGVTFSNYRYIDRDGNVVATIGDEPPPQ